MILRIARQLFTPVAIAFLAYFAWESRHSLADIIGGARPGLLLLAVLTWVLMHVLAPAFASIVFNARRCPLAYKAAADVHISNLPARYIPGGIWHTVGRIASFRKLGANQSDIAVFVLLENLLAACAAFALGGSVVAWYRNMQGWGQIAALTAMLSCLIFLVSPFVLKAGGLKKFGAFPIGAYLKSTLLVSLSWCVAATAFVIYLSAFPELQLTASALEIGGNYLFSWGIGFIAVFAPQGVGIFEVVSAELIRGSAPLANIAALLAGFRLVILAADSLTYGVFKLLNVSRDSAHSF